MIIKDHGKLNQETIFMNNSKEVKHKLKSYTPTSKILETTYVYKYF